MLTESDDNDNEPEEVEDSDGEAVEEDPVAQLGEWYKSK